MFQAYETDRPEADTRSLADVVLGNPYSQPAEALQLKEREEREKRERREQLRQQQQQQYVPPVAYDDPGFDPARDRPNLQNFEIDNGNNNNNNNRMNPFVMANDRDPQNIADARRDRDGGANNNACCGSCFPDNVRVKTQYPWLVPQSTYCLGLLVTILVIIMGAFATAIAAGATLNVTHTKSRDIFQNWRIVPFEDIIPVDLAINCPPSHRSLLGPTGAVTDKYVSFDSDGEAHHITVTYPITGWRGVKFCGKTRSEYGTAMTRVAPIYNSRNNSWICPSQSRVCGSTMCVPVDIPCPITEARLVNDTGAVVPDRYKWTSNGRKYVIELTRMPDGVMSSPVRPLTELTMNAVLGSIPKFCLGMNPGHSFERDCDYIDSRYKYLDQYNLGGTKSHDQFLIDINQHAAMRAITTTARPYLFYRNEIQWEDESGPSRMACPLTREELEESLEGVREINTLYWAVVGMSGAGIGWLIFFIVQWHGHRNAPSTSLNCIAAIFHLCAFVCTAISWACVAILFKFINSVQSVLDLGDYCTDYSTRALLRGHQQAVYACASITIALAVCWSMPVIMVVGMNIRGIYIRCGKCKEVEPDMVDNAQN